MNPIHQDLSNDTIFSQIKSRVPVPLMLSGKKLHGKKPVDIMQHLCWDPPPSCYLYSTVCITDSHFKHFEIYRFELHYDDVTDIYLIT